MSGIPAGFDDIESDELFALVWRDDLTGLYNRRFFARYMKQVADWAPGAPPVAMAMMDMDNLKRINDRLGHMQGDAALKRIGEIMLEAVGEEVYAIRYAGDEFALVLPNTGRDTALKVAEQLREAVVKDAYSEAELPEGLRPSLSIGIAVFPDDAPAGGDDLTEAADQALYYSKRTGKNKVTSAHDLKKDEEEVSDLQALAGFPCRTLVGREDSFAQVEEAVSLVLDKKNAFLLIEGPAGIGKTRFLSEVGKYAKERGLAVMIERCSAATREEPYKALAGLLDGYLRSRPGLLANVSTALDVQQRLALAEVLQVFKDLAPRRRPPRRKGPPPQGGKGPPPQGGKGPPRSKTPPPRKGPRPQGGRRTPPPQRRPTGSPQRRPTGRPGPRPTGRPPGRPPEGQRPPQKKDFKRTRSFRVKPLPKQAREMNPAELTAALFKGLVDLLYTLSLQQGLVILLDDLRSADDPTLEVMRRSLPLPGRVLFVGAARSEPGEGEVSGAYAAFREEMDKIPNAFVAELPNLEVEQTTELATNLLEGFRPPVEFADQLQERSAGNPLFIEGILKHLVDTDLLQREVGGWKVKAELPADLPLTLDTLLRNQLKIIDPGLAKVLDQAAVVGPNFEFNVLQASLEDEQSEGETLTFVDDAVKANILSDTGAEAGQADLEFSSQAVQEAKYETIEPKKREEAHRRVAEALPKDEPKKDAERAFHFGRAGDREKQDRFLRRVRERQELIFDREAVENLLIESHQGKIPEVSEEPPRELFAALPILAKHIATAAKVIRLYPVSSNVVKEALKSLSKTLEKVHQLAPQFTLSHRGNTFVVNGKTVDKAHGTGQYQEAVIGLYRVNSIKSLTFVAPPKIRQLRAFLQEASKHTVQVTLENYFWSVFSKQNDLTCLGIAQKTKALESRSETEIWRRVKPKARVAEAKPQLVKDLIAQLVAALSDLRLAPPEIKLHGEIVASLHRLLRRLFEVAPALAIHEGQGDTVVVNGVALNGDVLGKNGPALLELLRQSKVQALVVLKDIAPKELARFLERLARLEPGKVESISQDASLPNVLVGDGVYQLVHDLVRRRMATETGDGVELEGSLEELLEELLPLPERDEDLPAGFEWPSDAIAKRARTLYKLKPEELVGPQGSTEYLEVLEALLLEDRQEVARMLVKRMAVNFASEKPDVRKRAGELYLQVASKGSQELRARFFATATTRLCDALELESDFEAFEKLAECSKLGILDRVAEGDWDLAARLVWSLGRRREGRAETRDRLKKVSQRVLEGVIGDPRSARVFETLETGSQQERRRAARILEGMGRVAVDALIQALKTTQRARVETFLIDMLAALVPDSDAALQKEVTPSTSPEIAPRLLRAAAVVCQDPTPVLVSGLQNDDARVQSEAISVARSIGHNVAQNVLRWALAHGQAGVQLEAVKHLGELSRPDTVDSLLDLVQNTNLVEVQRECCLALGKLSLNRSHHEKVVPVLTNFLRTGGLLRSEYHQDVRAAAAWALGQMKTSDPARKALERALDDKDKRVRLTARLTLEGRKI